MDIDDEMSQICIFCGIIPEIVFGSSIKLSHLLSLKSAGDGGEDISCRLQPEHLQITEGFDGAFPSDYVGDFLAKLKCFFIEGLVFPRKHMDSR